MVRKFHVNIPYKCFTFPFAKFVGIYHVTLFYELLIFVVFVVVVVVLVCEYDDMGLCVVRCSRAERDQSYYGMWNTVFV